MAKRVMFTVAIVIPDDHLAPTPFREMEAQIRDLLFEQREDTPVGRLVDAVVKCDAVYFENDKA